MRNLKICLIRAYHSVERATVNFSVVLISPTCLFVTFYLNKALCFYGDYFPDDKFQISIRFQTGFTYLPAIVLNQHL